MSKRRIIRPRCKYCKKILMWKNWHQHEKKHRSLCCLSCRRTRDRARYQVEKVERMRKQREYKLKRRLFVIQKYGGKCVCCKEKRHQFLTFDHVNNDGAKHRRETGGTKGIIKWIIDNDFPKSIQILCFNCNTARHYYGKCPHKK